MANVRYRLLPQRELSFSPAWDDEVVVFDDFTQQTVALSAIAAGILMLVAEHPGGASDSAMHRCVATLHGDLDPADIENTLHVALREFERLDLVERVPV